MTTPADAMSVQGTNLEQGHPSVMPATTSVRPGFVTVDEDPDQDALVAALDEQAQFPAVKRLRAVAVELLAPVPGRRLLDAGCGIGDMTRLLAAGVAPGGTVIGVDTSATMLAEARRRTSPELPAVFRHGDVTRLDLDGESFDSTYSERVLQHLERPEVALSELVRVTRSGGRIVVVDTDWGMHALHGADPSLTARILTRWAEQAPNGWSGRRLPALFGDAGLTEPDIVADTITTTRARFPALEPFATMASVAEAHGDITAQDAQRWLGQLADASSSGTFFWAITMFLVAATKP